MFCRHWLAQLEQHHTELREAGLQVVSVGIGEPKHAQRYCTKLAPSTICVLNEDLSAYRAYGFRRTKPSQLLTLDVVMSGAKAVLSGHTQGEATGDTLMIGGNFIIDPNGIIRYAYYSKVAGDHPSFKDILQAAQNNLPT